MSEEISLETPHHTVSVHESHKHLFMLNMPILAPHQFSDMLSVLDTAAPGDEVDVHINSEGGCLATTVQIIHAMRTSNAYVTTFLAGEAYSAAGMILLAGDNIRVVDHGLFMAHSFSAGAGDSKAHELTQYVEASNKWFDRLVRDYYKDFLSRKEINALLKGQDIWLMDHEVRERLIKKQGGVKP